MRCAEEKFMELKTEHKIIYLFSFNIIYNTNKIVLPSSKTINHIGQHDPV